MFFSPQMAAKIATACAVLHNFCIDNGDEWDECTPDRDAPEVNGEMEFDAEQLRDHLKEYVWNRK